MEERIRERFSDHVLHEVMARYDITSDSMQSLDGFESFIFEFGKEDRSYILRIGHSLRRSLELIHGEIDWINFLSAGGASVARPVPSVHGRLVESIEDSFGGQFLAIAFDKAPGAPPRKEDLKADFFMRYGRQLGRMHALSNRYKPSNDAWRRMDWNDPDMLFSEKWLGPDDQTILERYRLLMEYLLDLPVDKAGYGMIHQDAHYGNFFMDEGGQITFFDFDDCCYSWYVNDIAIVLFYAALGQEDMPLFTQEFMTHFLRGYRQEYDLDLNWLKEIPYFLKLREMDLYAVIHRSFDVDNLENPWVAFYMRGRKQRIEEGIPFIDFDFGQLVGS